jgi:hypothetical protein
VNGGHCLLTWPKVTRPKDLGGLGISDLRIMSWALRARWPWLQKSDRTKPWSDFQIQTCELRHCAKLGGCGCYHSFGRWV